VVTLQEIDGCGTTKETVDWYEKQSVNAALYSIKGKSVIFSQLQKLY